MSPAAFVRVVSVAVASERLKVFGKVRRGRTGILQVHVVQSDAEFVADDVQSVDKSLSVQ